MFFRVYRFRNVIRSARQFKTSAHFNTDLTLTFASAGQVFYNKVAVRQVDVPTLSGRIGVLAEHVPTIACLSPGVVSVTENDGKTNDFFVSSGTVTVNSDSSIQIITEEAAALDDFDARAVSEGFHRTQSELSTAQTDLARAELQIALEAYEQLNQAVLSRSR
ncbi:unnamed protein product [Dicrocoelium dendriticum]|nr:unnamed protein product [Dicrocoelium dendriticum]